MIGPSRSRIAIALLLLLLVGVAAAQDGGVIVLEESDFEQVPESVRGQSLLNGALPKVQRGGGTAEVLQYDPRRDAKADIQFAVATAAREGKHVLLEIGGNWCPFCLMLDQFFAANADVDALLRKNYVLVKVNVSGENQNRAALAPYPPVRSFPHFLVLDGKGNLVHSQRIAHLGTRSGYSVPKFKTFLAAAAPRK